jgi:arsenate reductase (thioredoxin)
MPAFHHDGARVMQRMLFVDEDNASRSQIAEAFARLFGSDEVIAYSAGLAPAELLDDRAISLMAEVGCDLSAFHTKSLSSLGDTRFDVVISLGDRRLAAPPAGVAYGHWRIPDPTVLDSARYRDIRHDIGHRVRQLLNALETLAPSDDGSVIDLGND